MGGLPPGLHGGQTKAGKKSIIIANVDVLTM